MKTFYNVDVLCEYKTYVVFVTYIVIFISQSTVIAIVKTVIKASHSRPVGFFMSYSIFTL